MARDEHGRVGDHRGLPDSRRLCESCGRYPATEVLHRRPSRYAQIAHMQIDPRVLLCRVCWLDILCGTNGWPPERPLLGLSDLDPRTPEAPSGCCR